MVEEVRARRRKRSHRRERPSATRQNRARPDREARRSAPLDPFGRRYRHWNRRRRRHLRALLSHDRRRWHLRFHDDEFARASRLGKFFRRQRRDDDHRAHGNRVRDDRKDEGVPPHRPPSRKGRLSTPNSQLPIPNFRSGLGTLDVDALFSTRRPSPARAFTPFDTGGTRQGGTLPSWAVRYLPPTCLLLEFAVGDFQVRECAAEFRVDTHLVALEPRCDLEFAAACSAVFPAFSDARANSTKSFVKSA